ncbi:flagellar hook-associated protein FlgL [Helicobacter apodemus]|uniref:Flagellar biosynthesis protein FlgL n=1 Tax=Helicobacter apodemus TaxID=135569 RepID=A0A2U8FB23_9HELI|nr:flagellar hook-associated protein FlgL [Helicobacter apodemus]AWI33441.1 flagellar biosynthesis protein FlgL [Helicobacter apodemus]
MRIGLASTYTMYQYHQRTSKSGLDDALGQIQSGLKIQSGYQDTTIFNKTLSLDYDITTLEQSKSVANNALTYTNNTDTALKDLVANMTNFKTKLIQGGNDIHSETSRLAIAKDLKAIRDHFLSIANTSIGGEFIFGGSATTNPPFNPNGTYNGNNATLNALLGSNNALPYNITGEELFFGADNDTHRIISTNIPKFNQRELHPEIMDPNHPTGQGREVYITAEDTIRDLVGDDDSNPNNDPQEVFYITGRKADGTAFKAKFPMDTTSKVQDLLDRIGREFGNTEVSKVVDVTLNKWGQIEIKDLTSGRSNIEFSMISSKWQDPRNSVANGGDGVGFSNLDRAGVAGVKINTYVQSPFLNDFNYFRTIAVRDDNDHRIHTFPTTFRTEDNKIATTATLLKDVLPPTATRIELTGQAANTALDTAGANIDPPVILPITDTTTIQDLMDSIRTTYSAGGGNIDVQFSDGKIIVVDNNVSKKSPATQDDKDLPFTGNSSLRLFVTSQNANGATVNGFRYDYATEYDKVNFSKDGAKLTSNVSQIIRDSNKYATMDTKLSEVAGRRFETNIFNFKVKDVNGTPIEGTITLEETRSYMTITSPTQINNHTINNIQIPILNPNGNPPQVNNTPTPGNEVTYQQLADTLGIVMNLSNSNTADLQNVFNANADYTNATIKASYEKLIGDSKNYASITLNANGQLEIKDLNYSATRMDFMLYDNQANMFRLDANGRIASHSSLTFQANGAVIADDPHINFFQQIDTIIKSLEEGIYRPGGNSNYGDSMRNPGIQNAITTFDHLANHINKSHTKNGSQGSAFKYSIQRTEALIVQAKTARSETINVDHAEALLQFSQLSLNYQAMLSTIGKISQLSLVNYI